MGGGFGRRLAQLPSDAKRHWQVKGHTCRDGSQSHRGLLPSVVCRNRTSPETAPSTARIALAGSIRISGAPPMPPFGLTAGVMICAPSSATAGWQISTAARALTQQTYSKSSRRQRAGGVLSSSIAKGNCQAGTCEQDAEPHEGLVPPRVVGRGDTQVSGLLQQLLLQPGHKQWRSQLR